MKLKKDVVFSLIVSLVLSFVNLNVESNNSDIILSNDYIAVSAENSLKTVVPCGQTIGVTLSTDGVIVVNLSKILCSDGTEKSPAADAGLQPGDVIKKINNMEITNVEQLKSVISAAAGESLMMTVSRNNKLISTVITPQLSAESNSTKIGAWVKDAASGIGTLTFYDPDTKVFAALGHSINDPETAQIIDIKDGSIFSSAIVSVEKSQKGQPGELKGVFTETSDAIGTIISNNKTGICGKISDSFSSSAEPVPIAKQNEIKKAPAFILANIEGTKIEKFNIEIIKLFPDTDTGKDMIIKVTDKHLLEKTGGIVQGMSGSPIIQNGKIIGAVTHVFVNDPTRGYGIFIENMLAEAKKFK